MTVEITVEVGEPYADMLDELREQSDADVDDDLQKLLEDSIHDGYQTVIADN